MILSKDMWIVLHEYCSFRNKTMILLAIIIIIDY